MKYIVTYSTKTFEKSYLNCQAIHNLTESYEIDTLDACKRIIRDFMDVPIAELTLSQVKDDFTLNDYSISEEKAVQIQNYYNGRLALYNVILNDVDNQSEWQLLKYDIPAKYATFNVEEINGIKNTEITIQKC